MVGRADVVDEMMRVVGEALEKGVGKKKMNRHGWPKKL